MQTNKHWYNKMTWTTYAVVDARAVSQYMLHSENDSRMYFLIVLITDYCWRS